MVKKHGSALIVLAGGHSSRMGCDKASLRWHGTTLLADLLLRSSAAGFDEIIISSNAQPDISSLPAALTARIRIVADTYRDCGPLGGMEAAFCKCTCPYCVVLSVDLPFYDFSPLQRLLPAMAESPSIDAVIPVVKGRPQPLAAAYRRNTALKAIRCALSSRNYRVLSISGSLSVRFMDESAAPIIYANINTPSAYKDALAIDANRRRAVPVITISSGRSGSGKTTLAVRLISELSRRGYGVGYVKSTHHSRCQEKPDSDTDKACRAGAVQALLCSPDDVPDGLSKKQAVLNVSQLIEADLVIIESRSSGLFPVLHIAGNAPSPLPPGMITAVIGSGSSSSFHTFLPSQLDEICSYILYLTKS